MVVHSTSKIDQRGATIAEVLIKGGLVETPTRDRRRARACFQTAPLDLDPPRIPLKKR